MELMLIVSRAIYSELDSCGYCNHNKDEPYSLEWLKTHPPKVLKLEPQSVTIGVQVEQMTLSQYDTAINRGFRRSGNFLYKPDLLRTCCRMYTIRTSMDNLKISKQQRKVCNRFVREIGGQVRVSKKAEPFRLELVVEAQRDQKEQRFYTRFEKSEFSDEKFQLYKKYQTRVHGDDPGDVTQKGFDSFLCSSPFNPGENDEKELKQLNEWVNNYQSGCKKNDVGPKIRLGPTHECYYLDGELIAISVLDFLPTGVSSIYFIWDPDYPHLSLGTVSGLREIFMCQYLNLGYYYLGYYVSDCDKMKYKRNFGGEIMDCSNLKWYKFEAVDDIFAKGGLVSIEAVEENGKQVLRNKAPMTYSNEELYTSAEIIEKEINKVAPTSKLPHFKFPVVVPGLLSQRQLLKSLEEGQFEDARVLLWDGTMHRSFNGLSAKNKRVVIDVVRVLGFTLMSGGMVFV